MSHIFDLVQRGQRQQEVQTVMDCNQVSRVSGWFDRGRGKAADAEQRRLPEGQRKK